MAKPKFKRMPLCPTCGGTMTADAHAVDGWACPTVGCAARAVEEVRVPREELNRLLTYIRRRLNREWQTTEDLMMQRTTIAALAERGGWKP